MKRLLPRFIFAAVLATTVCQAAEEENLSAQLWAKSILLEKNGDYAGALALMPQFKNVSKDIYLAELRSGWLNYSARKYDDAARNYQMAAQVAPTSISPLMGLANTYIAQNELIKAEKAYEQVLARDASNYTALMASGSMSYARGDYRKSAQMYQAAVINYPEDTTALSGLAWSNLNIRKKREAADLFNRLLILAPEYPFAAEGFEAANGQKITGVKPQ